MKKNNVAITQCLRSLCFHLKFKISNHLLHTNIRMSCLNKLKSECIQEHCEQLTYTTIFYLLQHAAETFHCDKELYTFILSKIYIFIHTYAHFSSIKNIFVSKIVFVNPKKGLVQTAQRGLKKSRWKAEIKPSMQFYSFYVSSLLMCIMLLPFSSVITTLLLAKTHSQFTWN